MEACNRSSISILGRLNTVGLSFGSGSKIHGTTYSTLSIEEMEEKGHPLPGMALYFCG